jgi:hypothetical protein
MNRLPLDIVVTLMRREQVLAQNEIDQLAALFGKHVCVWQVENAQFGSHFVPNLATRFQVPKAHVAIGNSRQ